MIIGNDKPIRIIGYDQASSAKEMFAEISKTHQQTKILTPDDFFLVSDKQQYQYIISEWLDRKERLYVIDMVDKQCLDLITVIHDTTVIDSSTLTQIGAGTFIFPFCIVSIHSQLGRHCVIGSYSLIGHYSNLGTNCLLRPGVIINGKSTIGNNCVLNTRVTVTNKSKVSDNVELMAFTNVTKKITDPGKYIGTKARKIFTVDPN